MHHRISFAQHYKSRVAYYQPENAEEAAVVDIIARNQWRLLRVKKLASLLHNAFFAMLSEAFTEKKPCAEEPPSVIPPYLMPLLNREGIRIRFREIERAASLNMQFALRQIAKLQNEPKNRLQHIDP